MRTKNIYTLLIILLITILPFATFAQAPEDPPTDPADTPIDGGLSLLVAAGVAYGAKKAYNKKQKNKAAETDVLEK